MELVHTCKKLTAIYHEDGFAFGGPHKVELEISRSTVIKIIIEQCYTRTITIIATDEVPVSKKLKQMMFMENKKKVDQYLTENHWLNGEKTIKQAERQKILADLMQILGIAKPDMRLSALLKRFGYKLIAETNSKNANAPFRIETKPR